MTTGHLLIATRNVIDGEMDVREECSHREEGMMHRLHRVQAKFACKRCEEGRADLTRECGNCASETIHIMTEIAFMKLESVYGESIVMGCGYPVLHPLSHPKGQLFAATSFGLSHATHRLIVRGEVGINAAISNTGGTALAVASRGGHLNCMCMLLDLGAEVNALPGYACDGRTQNQVAPLVAAVFSRNVNCVRMLLGAGADVNGWSLVQGAFTGPALVAASVTGCVDIVQLLLQHDGIDANAVGYMILDPIGSRVSGPLTSLQFTRMNPLKKPAEDMALIDELLSVHPSPTFVGRSPGEEDAGDNSRSPEEDEDEDVDEEEMLVCVRGLEAEVHAMESGADHSEEELRAAMARLRTASEAVFRNLEDLYGDVVMCPEGESMLGISTPEGRLYFAATRDLVYTMRELITSGVVGVNAPVGFKGSTALGIVTLVSNDPHTVRMLISLGANVNPRFTQGRDKSYIMSAPLATACLGPDGPCNMKHTLRVLLAAGADVNGRCECNGYFNGPPLLAATLLGELEAVRVLLEQPKVDIHATGNGYTGASPVPFATNVSAIDVARGRLWPWADLKPEGTPVVEFDLILDMLMRRLQEECIQLAKLVVDEEQGDDTAEDMNAAGQPRGAGKRPRGAGRRTMVSKLKRRVADTQRLQCTGKPFIRELVALGRQTLVTISAAEEGRLE